MKTKQADYVTRDTILKLLSETELARVSTTETATGLPAGEAYLDLEHLELGVRTAPVDTSVMGRVLARKAVGQKTWAKILKELTNLAPTAEAASPE